MPFEYKSLALDLIQAKPTFTEETELAIHAIGMQSWFELTPRCEICANPLYGYEKAGTLCNPCIATIVVGNHFANKGGAR